ncbi:MAG: hypothetical protein ED556_04875 [Winogradskyella sp.]|uniref:papain-like cysteine protease family protein n=1 Tax=Winogradskyella sp. TaxID=1883156 RepID=UPI000F3CC83F|nr:papain-like cysteine protease family protein [Winogradskyella sp.]RNC86757.1 MAG: hypothetical protein ED556_04875 [Winogradskyella sp.]
MSKFEFYYLKSIKYKPQPFKSNWCWAACLSNMIEGLNSKSVIGNTQCNLVSYYRKYQNNPYSINQVYNGCCTGGNSISHQCNIGIETNDIKIIYGKGGFILEEVEDLNTILNYNWVKFTLIKNQAPILLKIIRERGYHASLITGFGEVGGCKYLLFSDPSETTGEIYQNMRVIEDNINDISQAWTTSVKDNFNLIEDKEIKTRYEKAIEFIAKIDGGFDIELSNPLNYIGHKHPAFIDRLLNSENRAAIINKEGEQLVKDFREQKYAGNCQPEVPIRSNISGDIVNLKFNDLDNPTDEILHLIKEFDARSYLKEYAIEIQIFTQSMLVENSFKIYDQLLNTIELKTDSKPLASRDELQEDDGDSIYVLPTSFPENYQLDYNIYKLKKFKDLLFSLPKATFFIEKDRDKPLPEEPILIT